ncbi:restriction endonuclease subunit S [Mycolicibacterium fortuitum]|uniref:restriction endonuclease subunit S n=1 Tax=Mycolicibacterium fortuitum TaxID=1766 RepID=UPI0007ED8E02|nr:restriction endonuclease subunit S [Mycolicibacterium fortuitum]OBK04948.1 hypothetical protein A5637_10880 [Mycolicibacterium fortuitum]OBK58851.1 hypothetical protein A5654_32410 [Mycolicibacterium fortuitum]UBV23366.1 restriction endonuclease subunit S [Mycolicibacterium fortuitum]WAY17859.1 restriction endonuclease subunit S [Mycolicibacterium fortuitum]
MNTVSLGELISPAGFKAGNDSDHPVYSVTKHSGFVPSTEYFKKQIFSRDLAGYKRVRPGDFAYATIHLDEGSIGIAPSEGLISPMYTVFRPNTAAVIPEYLLRFMKSPMALAQYPRFGKGSVHRRKSISFDALCQLLVPLPPPDEQRRIAMVLDRADSLRNKRQQSIEQAEALAQSIFTNMFGDPGSDSDKRPTVRFSEIADLQGGRNLVAEDDQTDSPYRVLKISSVTSGEFKPSESKPLPPEYQPPQEHLVRQGDLLMSRANTTELVGAVAHVDVCPTNLALPDKIWRFVWHDPESVPVYYWALFRNHSIRCQISRLSSGTGGSMKNISKAKLEQLELPRTSILNQHEFARRIAAIPRPQTREFDELFDSLQSRAFRGEL